MCSDAAKQPGGELYFGDRIMNRQRKNLAAGVLCGLLLLLAIVVYHDWYRLPFFYGGKKTVTVGVFSDSYWEVQNGYSYRILDDAIHIFEKEHPEYQAEYVSGVMKDDYAEWLSEQMLLGTAPDLFFVLPENFNDMVELGVLKDLEALTEKDKDFGKGAFYASAWLCGQFGGQQYALPYECAPKLMFVNKSILDREGLDIPKEDWSWNDFYQICRRVTKDLDGDGIPDQFGAVNYTWQDAFESNGAELFGQDGKSCSLTGPAIEEAVTFMEDLNDLSEPYSITSREFDRGNVAFQPMSFSEYRAYKPYPLSVKKYSGFAWGCIPMPAGPRGDNISSLDTMLLAMNAGTKNEAMAWELMKILTCREEIQEEIFEYSEGVSVLRRVTESDETLQRLIEDAGDAASLNQEILSSAVERAAVAPRFRNYDEAVAEVDRAMNEIIGGDANISTELIIWNRAINKKLRNNGW